MTHYRKVDQSAIMPRLAHSPNLCVEVLDQENEWLITTHEARVKK
jgi:hypothetical protein